MADQTKAFWFLGYKNFCLPKLAEEIMINWKQQTIDNHSAMFVNCPSLIQSSIQYVNDKKNIINPTPLLQPLGFTNYIIYK